MHRECEVVCVSAALWLSWHQGVCSCAHACDCTHLQPRLELEPGGEDLEEGWRRGALHGRLFDALRIHARHEIRERARGQIAHGLDRQREHAADERALYPERLLELGEGALRELRGGVGALTRWIRLLQQLANEARVPGEGRIKSEGELSRLHRGASAADRGARHGGVDALAN